MSRDCKVSDFDGNTTLVWIHDNDYVFIPGFEFINFSTEDKTIDFISVMGNKNILTTIAFGEKYTFFKIDHYKFIENNKIEERILLISTNDSSNVLNIIWQIGWRCCQSDGI